MNAIQYRDEASDLSGFPIPGREGRRMMVGSQDLGQSLVDDETEDLDLKLGERRGQGV